MIDRQTVERIKDAANIVDVVSEFVTLKKAGANYKGLCPFHDEKTPSFIVSPARGTCHCFGCGKGGNPISFIMEHEQMTYPEALRWLAKKYNIEIQERELSNEEKEQQSQRESMFIVNEWACKYFEDLLHNDVDGVAIGMQYLRSRGFRDDVIRKFQIGYDSDNRYQLATKAKEKGYKEEFLEKTGICYKTDRGELIDRFAGRVIFPWIGVSGKVVGFSARVLDQRTKGVNQKYVNSPDSEIYHKANELYGIWQAKRAIAKENRVYMVEGQADVISLYQSGIENVVANSGTALSLHQIHMLHRFTGNITLLYDGDAAGIHAAMRGTDMLLSEGMNLKVLLIPDGKDPDELARTMSAEQLKSFLEENAVDFMQFKTDLMLKGVTDPQKRSEAVASIVNSISLIPNAILRDTYLHLCAEKSGVKEENLISAMNRMIRERKERGTVQPANTIEAGAAAQNATPAAHPPMQGASPIAQASEVEQMLIQMILKHGEKIIFRDVEDNEGNKINLSLAQYVQYNLGADNLKFTNSLYNDILQEAVDMQEKEKDFKAEPYFLHHHNIKISQIAIRMTEEKFHLSGSQQMSEDEETIRRNVEHLLLDFRKDFVDERLKQLKIEINSCGSDMERMLKLMQEFKDMQDIRNALAHALGNNVIV
ncbi:MAG: DNA primase [Prevotella sp.]|jgi:DNA primase|nr:DNA primase [Prevotella sp.]